MKYLRSAMRRSKHRKPPSLYLQTTTREKSPRCSSVLSDCDADDEQGFMSSGDFLPSRPLSLTIPAGPYCPRRPTLQEVLADTAPPPWTLSAFMAYLSQNHCLETLEFTMDANRYSKHHKEMLQKDHSSAPTTPKMQEVEYVRMLWQKLLDAYITPNGPREVNLPSNVRDHLLALPSSTTPPDPTELAPAVKIIYELMDESVLVPFLNSVAMSRGPNSFTDPWASEDRPFDYNMSASLDERSLSPAKLRNKREGSPPTTRDLHSHPHRASQQSHLTAALGLTGISRLSTYISGSTTSSTDAPDGLTDDSTDSPSTSVSALEPMTPPSTPPTSNLTFQELSPITSPVVQHRTDGSSWKKMGAKLGWKKSRSARGSNSSSTSGPRYPLKETNEEDIPALPMSPAQGPVVGPAGFPGHRDISRSIPPVLGGTSLKPSEGSQSPLLEAHPGSPVDLTGRRPSLSAALAGRRPYKTIQGEVTRSLRSPLQSGKEVCIMTGGVVAKSPSAAEGSSDVVESESPKSPKMRMHLAATQPFFIPAKVPEHQEVLEIPSPLDETARDFALETAMDFHFEEENGIWISAIPIAHQSHSSIGTSTTGASTLVDDKYGNSAVAMDTCVDSSAASVLSSAGSMTSGTTNITDIYGWEEELDRKSSLEAHSWAVRDVQRRLPSGSRTMGPRVRTEPIFKRTDGKRKSLLHRVLNISRREADEPMPMLTSMPCPTSA